MLAQYLPQEVESHITVTFVYGRWLGHGLGYHPKDCAKAQSVISISGSEDQP